MLISEPGGIAVGEMVTVVLPSVRCLGAEMTRVSALVGPGT